MSEANRPWAFRLGQCFATALTGFLVTWFLVSLFYAWKQADLERWGQQGFQWLFWDFWGQQRPWREAALAAGLTFILALFAEGLGRMAWLAPLRLAHRFCGTGTAVVCGAVLVVLPPGLAHLKRPDAEGKPNVLLICLDTWRSDHASFLGYERPTHPGLDQLVQSGVVFENAVAQAPWTMPSVASLFTSLVPSLHGARSHQARQKQVAGRRWVRLGEEMVLLTEVFRDAGYDTAAWSRNPNITDKTGFGSGFETYKVYRGADGRTEVQVDAVNSWLQEWDEQSPFFLYMHILDPHYPYEAPAPFGGRIDKSGLDDFQLTGELVEERHLGNLPMTPEMNQKLIDTYDEELMYVDHHLTPFLEEVMKRYPNTLVVIYGDHGDEFLEHGKTPKGEPGLLGHGHSLYDELVYVPLLFWGPGVPVLRTNTQVRIFDVFPTLLELADLRSGPWTLGHLQGKSLVSVMKEEETAHRPAPIETGGDGRPPLHYRGLRIGEWKMIRREEDSQNSKPYFELYNLLEDPGELRNLADQSPELVQRLYKQLQESGWYFDSEDPSLPRGMARSGQVSKALEQELAGLGYGGGDEEDDH